MPGLAAAVKNVLQQSVKAAKEAAATNTREVEVSTSTTTPKKVRVPSWVPKGHPCQWGNDQLTAYEDRMEPVPMETWRAIDDQVYGRPCDNPDCEMMPWSEDVAEGEVVEERPAATSSEVEVKAGVEFDFIQEYLPAGHPDDWSDKDWDDFQEAMDALPQDQAQALDEAAWKAMETETPTPLSELPEGQPDAVFVSTDLDLDKDVWEMSEKEYEDFQAYLMGAIDSSKSIGSSYTPRGTSTKSEDSKQLPPPAKGAYCKPGCSGPGSKDAKYANHLASCPLHPEYTPDKWVKPGSSTYSSCKHDRQAVPLENNLSIYASAYRDVKYCTDEKVDIGVYMYDSWGTGILVTPGLEVPWAPEVLTQQVLLDWPDFGIPDLEYIPLVDIIRWMLDQLAAGKHLETGCMGGHGRTGTMLACILVAQGVPPGTALVRVRKDHCSKAVENEKQGQFVAAFYKLYHGNEDWRKDHAEAKLFKKQVKAGHKSSTTSGTWGKAGFGSTTTTPPKWDEVHKVWTSYNWRAGFTWDKELKVYVNLNYIPTKGGESK